MITVVLHLGAQRALGSDSTTVLSFTLIMGWNYVIMSLNHLASLKALLGTIIYIVYHLRKLICTTFWLG
jgi:hypothetical protein